MYDRRCRFKTNRKNTIHELEVELEEEIFMRYLPISYKR